MPLPRGFSRRDLTARVDRHRPYRSSPRASALVPVRSGMRRPRANGRWVRLRLTDLAAPHLARIRRTRLASSGACPAREPAQTPPARTTKPAPPMSCPVRRPPRRRLGCAELLAQPASARTAIRPRRPCVKGRQRRHPRRKVAQLIDIANNCAPIAAPEIMTTLADGTVGWPHSRGGNGGIRVADDVGFCAEHEPDRFAKFVSVAQASLTG